MVSSDSSKKTKEQIIFSIVRFGINARYSMIVIIRLIDVTNVRYVPKKIRCSRLVFMKSINKKNNGTLVASNKAYVLNFDQFRIFIRK